MLMIVSVCFLPDHENEFLVDEAKAIIRSLYPDELYVNSKPHITIIEETANERRLTEICAELSAFARSAKSFRITMRSEFKKGLFRFVPNSVSEEYLQSIYGILRMTTSLNMPRGFRPHITVAAITDKYKRRYVSKLFPDEFDVSFEIGSIAVRVREGQYDRYVLWRVFAFEGNSWNPSGVQQKIF